MKKRALSFTLCIIFAFTALCGRLFQLTSVPQEASVKTGLRIRDLDTVRGFIYDRNLSPLANSSFTYTACVLPTIPAYKTLLKSNINQEDLKNVQKGYLVTCQVNSPDAYEDCDDIRVIKQFQRYNSNSLIHILGYTDTSNTGVCGIEKYYDEYLKQTGGTLSIAYYADANNRVLTGERAEIRDDGYYNSAGLVLTIDKTAQEILENALINNNITCGAGVIADAKTGEILACASTPVYSRDNLASAVNSDSAPFMNRAFSAFPVGSVFKVITAAGALENKVDISSFYCDGGITFSGNKFNCNKPEGHKEIDFNNAMAQSCNPYFINMGVSLGNEKLLETSKRFHLGESIDFGNSFMTDSGVLPHILELVCDADTGNLAFGQGRLTATPIQITAVFSTIANNGCYIEPTLIKGTVDHEGTFTKAEEKESEKIISDSTCNILKEALSKTTVDGTGTSAQSHLYNCCAKTATAQSGQYDENGKEINFCWFVGFFPKENPQYTICIMKENGSSGGSDCGPAFKEIAQALLFNF